nr:hypothetical protein [Tanacetum cinerariifolium]
MVEHATSTSTHLGMSNSYANVTGKPSRKSLNIRTLYTPRGNRIDVVVPVDSIRAISEWCTNTAYDFFLRKHVAYPIVANYVWNTWGKYSPVKSMLNYTTGLFSFQFSSMDGFDTMQENATLVDDEGQPLKKIIMANVIPPGHVIDLPVVDMNQLDDVHVIFEHVLVDEDEDPKEEEFEEEEEPQEEEHDMEVDIKEDENELELAYPYEEVDPLNPSPPASNLELKDVIQVEDTVEPEDETVSASVHECGRRNGRIGESGRKLGNAEERAECKNLKKEQEEARFSNTLLRMQSERVKRDLYWTRVRAHEFYREMIRRGFVFGERLNEAIDVPAEDEKSPSSEPRGSPRDS